MSSWNRYSFSHGVAITAARTNNAVMMPPSRAARCTSGPPPTPCARRWATARPTSCSSGRKKPVPATKMTAQKAENAAAAPPTREFSDTTT